MPPLGWGPRMKLGNMGSLEVIRHAHMACGVGGGAKGFNRANPRVGNLRGRFVCAGGIDVDAGAIREFERITGVKGTVLDLFSRDQFMDFHDCEPPRAFREATPADVYAAYGPAIDIAFASMPCKGFSGLLSQKQSETRKYQALNGLTLRGIWLLLEAYKDEPIGIIAFENVPRIRTRGRWLLDQIIALLRSYGYHVTEGDHDCGELGNLAQSRSRFLLIARHPDIIPPFIYQPAKHKLRGVGEVIGKLPLPGDPVAGVMHRVPSLQWQTWVRLAFVPAGRDWRALNDLRVENGMLTDFGIVPEIPLRNGALGVHRWSDTSGVVIGNQRSPLGGKNSVADPRVDGLHNDGLGVRGWADKARVVASASRPANGAHSVADPRPGYGPHTHHNALGVREWEKPSGVVTGASHVTGAALSVADPRPTQANQSYAQYGVLAWGEKAGAVSGQSAPGGGAYSVQDPRLPGKPRFNNTFRIVAIGDPAKAVAGPGGPAGGQAVADPRPAPKEYSSRKYKITAFGSSSRAVIGASTTGDGAYAVADPRCNWGNGRHQSVLRVNGYDQATGTIPGAVHSVTGGQPCVADERREHYQTCGHYGVVPWQNHAGVVSASIAHDNGPGNVADPRDGLIFCASSEVAEIKLPTAKERLVCRIISTDETWHRPFTTLELAALQSLIIPEEVFDLNHATGAWSVIQDFELGGKSDSTRREWIGNMVPPLAAEAMAEEFGEAVLLARLGETFALSSKEIWVSPIRAAMAIDQDQVALRIDAGLA